MNYDIKKKGEWMFLFLKTSYWIVMVILFNVISLCLCIGIIAQIVELVWTNNTKKTQGIYERFVKRGMDTFVASVGIVILSPIFIITSILVGLKLGRPVLFFQDRPGRNEKVFKLCKFRSMTDARDDKGELLPNEQRMTKFGNKLRATSIDELPELINIIKGDMSIVGPRPLLVRYLPYYSDEERKRHSVRPGLTGLAQVTNDGTLNWNDKLKIDVEYTKNITFQNDIRIMLKTLKTIFVREDTHNDGFKPLDEERELMD